MIMRYSRILISTALMTAMIGLSGCYDDKGNYDYISEDELISVKIAELSDISVKANELLEVIPELKNNNSRRYDYCWYAMKENYPYNVDTLSYEQDLSIVCNLEVGKYTLYYMISDPVLDIYVNTSFALSVTATDINTGWYIFKEEGDYSDIDYISLANESKNNLFKNILNIDPPYGKPVGLDYVPNNYNHEKENADGTVTLLQSQSVIHVVTEHDFISLNANDMSVFKTLDDQFYEKPAEIEFQNVNSDMYGSQVIIANNNLHTVGSAIGKLGYQLQIGRAHV